MVVELNDFEDSPDSDEDGADEDYIHPEERQWLSDPNEVKPNADELSKGRIDEWTNEDQCEQRRTNYFENVPSIGLFE
ncbi:hypothetical protein [Haladaptatus halobius]|uniref:hypothetical protein n=1 Tax=Haladaptatus halobius TaxID=2884875 RepID=UPI001D0A7F07|nr:hypothetical protein [Haladaptatus halobius]